MLQATPGNNFPSFQVEMIDWFESCWFSSVWHFGYVINICLANLFRLFQPKMFSNAFRTSSNKSCFPSREETFVYAFQHKYWILVWRWLSCFDNVSQFGHVINILFGKQFFTCGKVFKCFQCTFRNKFYLLSNAETIWVRIRRHKSKQRTE